MSEVQRWKGKTGLVHAVKMVRSTPPTFRTLCGIPVLQQEIFMADDWDGEQTTCSVCRDILREQ